MKTSIVGFPRIGAERELKFAVEQFFESKITAEDMLATAVALRESHWMAQRAAGVDFIPSNDFSLYDNLLDTAVLFDIIPKRYRELGHDELRIYFAMARGYQGEEGDVHALAMKKWFNTNYHYLVPEVEDDTVIQLSGSKIFDEFIEAQRIGILTKPVIIGAYTLLKLTRFTGGKNIADIEQAIISAYAEVLRKLDSLGAQWVQMDEPALVMDMTADDNALFTRLYEGILSAKGNVKVVLQTYFGDIRDCYKDAVLLPFDGIGLDFIEGNQTLGLIAKHGFPSDKTLFAGVVNGKNIWKSDYQSILRTMDTVLENVEKIVCGTSCSLLHVPYTLKSEIKLDGRAKEHLAFAYEKLDELADLKRILSSGSYEKDVEYLKNQNVFKKKRDGSNENIQKRVMALTDEDFIRFPDFATRELIQKEKLGLPLLPTTTIGSFPQTADVRANRSAFRNREITEGQYSDFNKRKIAECITLQEEIGLDVLVHGEFERNDMVEYFGENLDGFVFTQQAWVQSYGTRCVKPPIIWSDVSRSEPITVEYATYAQSCTGKPVKGMLTGPVTILNWSFPREDISLRESALQIALAIREEVLDLEAGGIGIIQIDEAALREKLPLRKSDWHSEYLDWAIPAFRLVHSGVKPETQIHTHMCYSEFTDIIPDIDAMDVDVISFEASRSDLLVIDALSVAGFERGVGPGVYDIHSPRVPSVEEIKKALEKILSKLSRERLWVNPDCGLKTRGENETALSLKNLATAAGEVRESITT